jgi:hypothetical protein
MTKLNFRRNSTINNQAVKTIEGPSPSSPEPGAEKTRVITFREGSMLDQGHSQSAILRILTNKRPGNQERV